MRTVRIRFLRPWQRWDRGDVAEVEERIAEVWIRQRAAAPEPLEPVCEVAALQPSDVRTADAPPARRQRR